MFITSLMMPRIEETVETYVTGSRWTGPGNCKNKCKAVKTENVE